MATQILTVASFDDGAAIVRVAYDDVSGGVLGFRAVITRGNAILTLAWSDQ